MKLFERPEIWKLWRPTERSQPASEWEPLISKRERQFQLETVPLPFE